VVTQESSNFAAGLPELAILRLLQDREMYGYEIVQAIALSTRALVAPGEGLIYPLLHSLLKVGALKSRRKSVGGRSRVYYRLTVKGEQRLTELIGRWKDLNGAIEGLLTGGALGVR
jgi:PadR family transcriptional regulator, regulatory protein PadR